MDDEMLYEKVTDEVSGGTYYRSLVKSATEAQEEDAPRSPYDYVYAQIEADDPWNVPTFDTRTRPESILEEAKKLVDGARGDKYGHPSDDFAALGRFWGAILTRYYEGQGQTLHIDDIPPATVALMLGAIKLNREAARHMRDNLVDGVGYWYTVELIKERGGE